MSHLFFAGAMVCVAQAEPVSELEPVARESGALFLTLDSAVDRLKAQSPKLLMERETVKRSLAASYQVRANLLPQISLNTQQTRQQFGSTSFSATSGSRRSAFGARIEASQVLFDGTKYSEFRAAGAAHTVAEFDYQVAQEDLLELTAGLYYTQLRDLRRIEIVQSNIERDQALVELARRQLEAGAAIQLDVTRAEVRVATQRRLLMEAQTLAQDSILQLKSLLDLDPELDVRLDRSVFERLTAAAPVAQDAEFVAQAEQRPELRRQREALEQARLVHRAAVWKRLPRVELFGEWGYDSEEAFDREEGEAWLMGISASIPLFEGGRIAAEKREARAAVRQYEYRLRDLENEVKRQFRFSWIDMDSRRAQIGIAQDEVRLGEAEVAQSQQRYREGLADNRALIDARQNLADAEDSYLQSVYLYALSRLAFARATGDVERFFESDL